MRLRDASSGVARRLRGESGHSGIAARHGTGLAHREGWTLAKKKPSMIAA